MSVLTTTSSRWWGELTYMGHRTLALALARSGRGRSTSYFSPPEGRTHPARRSRGVRRAPPPSCRIHDPEALLGRQGRLILSRPVAKCSKAGAAAILSPPLAFGQPQGPNAVPRLTQMIVCAHLSRFPRRCDVP